MEERYVLDKAVRLMGLPIYFHWADSFKTIHSLENLFSKEELFAIKKESEYFKELKYQLENRKIWIKGNPVIELNLWDIYHSVLRVNKNQINLYEKKKVSMLSPQGPFKNKMLIDFVNADNLRFVLYQLLIKNKLPHRQFRVRLNEVINLKIDKKMEAIQLTEMGLQGLLFKVNHKIYKRIIKNDKVEFFFNSEHLNLLIRSFQENRQIIKSNQEYMPTYLIPRTNSKDSFLVEVGKLTISKSFLSKDHSDWYMFFRFQDMENKEFREQWKFFSQWCETEILKVA